MPEKVRKIMSEPALKKFAVREDDSAGVPLPKARNGQRFMASVLDGFFCSALNTLGMVLLTKGLHANTLGMRVLWGFLVFPSLYFVLPVYASGQTLGKKLLKLKVENAQDPALGVSICNAFLRELPGKTVGFLAFGLGYVRILRHPEGKAWHDSLAKTRVVSLVED